MKNHYKLTSMGLITLSGLLLLFGCASTTGTVSSSPPGKNASVSIDGITLTAPEDKADNIYLGLSGKAEFKINQIKAQVVLINIFSSTCPHCQQEAPNTNLLFKTIEQNPELRQKIKILGIGLRDSLSEVNQFKKDYDVPFPLFPDEDLSISERLEIKGTPTMIGVHSSENGGVKILFSKVGSIGEIPWFIDFLIDSFQLK